MVAAVVVVVGKMFVPEKNELPSVIWMKINRKCTHMMNLILKINFVIVNMYN